MEGLAHRAHQREALAIQAATRTGWQLEAEEAALPPMELPLSTAVLVATAVSLVAIWQEVQEV